MDQTDYTSDKSLQPGTVSNGYGFMDSPDAEVIAGGINSKAHNSVALGRHGSLFLWGFASAPAGMTPSGQSAFVNAVCYIQKFDHQPRQVRRVARDRGWALESARFGKDEAKLESLRGDLEFLRPGEKRDFLVDQDCKALGLSNRSPALLEACVARLEKSEDVERASRLLQRYTGKTFASAAEWRGWLTAAKPRLFFSDIGGYRWFEAVDQDVALRRTAGSRWRWGPWCSRRRSRSTPNCPPAGPRWAARARPSPPTTRPRRACVCSPGTRCSCSACASRRYRTTTGASSRSTTTTSPPDWMLNGR